MLRPLFAVLALTVLCLAATAGRALAGDAPWCAVVNEGTGGMVWHCNYYRFEDCAPNVIAGNRGFCSENPYWLAAHSARSAPAGVAVPKHRKHRKRRKHHLGHD